MRNYITKDSNKKQFEQFFKNTIETHINKKDKPALRQAWNDTIDAMIKDGQLSERAGFWQHPDRFLTVSERISAGKFGRSYVRKTTDVYEIQGHYAHGWECVTTENTRQEARDQLKVYRENESNTAFRLVSKRVKLELNAK